MHYGTRAVGGAGLFMLEASSVRPDGRITTWDQGMWDQGHVAAVGPVVVSIVANGARSRRSSWPMPAARPPTADPGRAGNN